YILARHRAGDGDTLHLVVVSPMFHPVDKDLIIRLEPPRGSGWRPYTPGMGEAFLEAEWRGGGLFIELDLTLRHAGFSVEWGDPRVSGGTILLDVSLRGYMGPAAQVVTHKSHTYIVEGLDPSRTYAVELRFNGERYTSMAVSPPSTPSPGSSTSTTVIDTTPPTATRPAGPRQASALTVTVTRTAAPTLGLALVAALAVGVAIGFLAHRG
ncbi:MAG: hypothetical protein QI199_03625, partial [Candidatus Korarchaeota archaeon]|nr:hypothetical protein [Candidatus Korarchaeota archaeon]